MSELAQITHDGADVRRRSREAARKADERDRRALAELLAAAFFDDPVLSWVYKEPETRDSVLPSFFSAVIDACRSADETYASADHVTGAVCLPPGREPDETMIATVEEISGENAARVFELVELMDAEHPVEPHYYVFFLGTRPEWQSRGRGSALLRQLLEPCDRDGIPAYLEATSERNKQLYLRHGFEVTGEIQVPGGPAIWPMWRAAA